MDQSSQTTSTLVTGGSDHRDLYLLIVGIVAGIVLGPGVLYRISTDTYNRWFVGGEAQRQALDELAGEAADRQQRLLDSGATPAAINQALGQIDAERAITEAQRQQESRAHEVELLGITQALVIAAIAIMIVESLLSPTLMARRRLSSARYAVLAIWVAIVLAQPALLLQMGVLLPVLLVAVAVVAALIPFGRRAAAPSS